MPDKRSHRGPHPEDVRLFAEHWWPALRAAVHDLAWLLSHDYAINSALKLVGDRYQLNERQRIAVMRCTCSDQSLELRRSREVAAVDLRDKALIIDGYNVLTTVEAALGGGVLLRGRDGCLRDMASMHGHYKRVAETAPALEHIGQTLAALASARIEVLLDSPVSNSGRLKTMVRQLGEEHAWWGAAAWTITLVQDPDPLLAMSSEIVATADSVILDGTRNPKGTGSPAWFNFAAIIVARHAEAATVIDMTDQ
jgi:hypothetical protein